MWRHWKPCTLLSGIKKETAAVENSLTNFQEIKHRVTISSSDYTSGNILKRIKSKGCGGRKEGRKADMGKSVWLDSLPSSWHAVHCGLKLTSILSKPTAPRATPSHLSCISHGGTTGMLGKAVLRWLGSPVYSRIFITPGPSSSTPGVAPTHWENPKYPISGCPSGSVPGSSDHIFPPQKVVLGCHSALF